MVKPSLSGLILTVSLATISTFGAAVGNLDACGSLSAKNGNGITYADVESCYKSIPLKRDVASSTLQTVYTLMSDYYIFRDSALTPLQKPFTSAPVDILRELRRMAASGYANDFSFHTALSTKLDSLHDAHVSYGVQCYRSYKFTQNLVLYAPVVNGKQSIRVYKDFQNRGYEDCAVQMVDGQDAIKYLMDWSVRLSVSKDAGVRLNEAIATQHYDARRKEFVLVAGSFAERNTLPEKSNVEYRLQCGSRSIRLRETWKVIPQTRENFQNAQEYVSKVCVPPPPKSNKNGIHKRELFPEPEEYPLLHMPKRAALLDFMPLSPRADAAAEFADATRINTGNASVIYQLKSQPDVGVIVIPSHMPSDRAGEFKSLLQGMSALHQRNVTKLIIDFQGNGGGYVNYASLLVNAFFPSKGAQDFALPKDLRVTKSIQDLSTGAFKSRFASHYDASHYIDIRTKKPYTSNDMFLRPLTRTRNGRQAQYSQPTTDIAQSLPKIDLLNSFAWSDKPNNIRILTDGRCGSSCALSTHYFHALRKVPVVAVGGLKDQPLSMFSFAGGSVTSLKNIMIAYHAANMKSPVNPLLYTGTFGLPIVEVFAHNRNVPLEYDVSQHSADLHLDYDTKNARSRDTMWNQVAARAWGN
ncbi:hypothetical protein BGX28_008574 [Mortierella sp. GBA30]|nr:hypothetical protein BGX28_008574 [Mortierella sp. GBA30]